MSRHQLRLHLYALITTALLALTSGCTPKLQYLAMDPSMTHAAMAQGKVAVMPVGVSTDAVADEEVEQMQHRISSAISERRGAIPVLGLSHVQQSLESLPPDDHPAAIFAATGSLPAERVKELSGALGARYVVVASISNYAASTYRDSERRKITNSKGKVVGHDNYTMMNHEGSLSGGMTVFDGETGMAVWEGRHTVSDVNTNEYKDAGNVIEAVVEIAAKERKTYPPPPRPSELAGHLFVAMVLNWPEAED